MGVNDKLRSKRADFVPPPEVKSAPQASPIRFEGSEHGAVTSGRILMLKQENEALKKENADVRSRPTAIRIDPKLVLPSKFANRHQQSFSGPEFDALVQEIESSGGNIQPIKVRPVGENADTRKYEIIFGHRRHAACLAAGVKVLALVEEMSDSRLFVEMDRENRQRANLKPYEQGVMYKNALDAGLFKNASELSREVGADKSMVSRAIAIATLPGEVLSAFNSPLDIQYRWGDALNAKDPKDLLDRCSLIESLEPAVRGKLSPEAVFQALTSNEVPDFSSGGELRVVRTKAQLFCGNKNAGAHYLRKGDKHVITIDEKLAKSEKVRKILVELSRLLEAD